MTRDHCGEPGVLVSPSRARGALGALACLALALAALPALADEPGSTEDIVIPPVSKPPVSPPRQGPPKLEDPPSYGVYYDAYEPTFYTGFAPRAHDPERIHIQLGRGNQLRVTTVLSDAALESYARDLLFRFQTYQELIAEGRIVLTQNLGFEALSATLEEVDLEGFVAAERELPPEEIRGRNLELMERLNPGRVFEIALPIDALRRRWAERVTAADRAGMDEERQLDLLNAMLPTRLWIAVLEPGASKDLRALVAAAPTGEARAAADGAAQAEFASRYAALLSKVSGGIYPLVGGELDGQIRFDEFTAIWPIGSFNEYVDYHGRKIPLYPTPGRRALTTHQRTHTVDHIPTKAIYSYSPWIPYMHVGTALHNSFHTLWWQFRYENHDFVPDEWRNFSEGHRDGKKYGYLWLLSRGPMSSGCTHLNTGHINELRHILPSDTEKLYSIDAFLNRSYDYDVFDIDGDMVPEVMGVRYYIAYSLKNIQREDGRRTRIPNKLRVRNERRSFYDWLYGGELRYDEDGNGWFPKLQDGKFIGRTARKGREYEDLKLYEAEFEPNRLQFYRMQGIEFARELRKVAIDHPFEGLPPKVASAP